ncbi:hypothetical protein [Streptomyces antibioticus]|uniref:hypothetical protein n=1 Tax=Streptomyces antibioticus TaxID=1890 RepID=UPI0036D7DD5F
MVDVYTIKEGQRHAFRMRLDDIQAAISSERELTTPYRPEPLDTDDIDFDSGTRIILTNLKKNITQTEAALKKRLARRFSALGNEFKFTLGINGNPITPTDRDYYHKLEYVWIYGDEDYADQITGLAMNAAKVSVRPVITESGEQIKGWIGSVFSSDQLRESGENLNKVVVLARGRLAHEDLLENISDSSFYRQYVIGELNADFIDADDEEDITTSSRQRLDEDDPRFLDLKKFFESEMKQIKSDWGKWREDEGVSTARQNPAIDSWFGSLTGIQRSERESFLVPSIG